MKKTKTILGALLVFGSVELSSSSASGVGEKRSFSKVVTTEVLGDKAALSAAASSDVPSVSKRSRREVELAVAVAAVSSASSSSTALAGAGAPVRRALSGATAVASMAASPELEATQASLLDVSDEHGEIDLSEYPPSHQILLKHFLKWVKEGVTIGKPKERIFAEEKVKVTSYALVKGVDGAGHPIVERYGYVVARQKEDTSWATLLICYAEAYKESAPKIPHAAASLEPHIYDKASSYEAGRSAFREYRINWRLYKRLLGGHVRWQHYSPVAADRKSIHRILIEKFALSQRVADYMTSLN